MSIIQNTTKTPLKECDNQEKKLAIHTRREPPRLTTPMIRRQHASYGKRIRDQGRDLDLVLGDCVEGFPQLEL